MNNENLQRIVSYGYIYLVILGIIKEALFYYPLDINILKYSSIMDILVSPIADMTTYPLIILFFIALGIGLVFFRKYLSNHPTAKFTTKYLSIKENEELSTQKFNQRADNHVLGIFFVTLICFFLGFGIGGGNKTAQKMKEGSFNFKKYGNKVKYNSGESKLVYIIDHNSSYYFFIEEGKKNITVVPVSSIESIEIK